MNPGLILLLLLPALVILASENHGGEHTPEDPADTITNIDAADPQGNRS
ncbi:hypothetical protein [Marinobacter nauticus]